MPQGRREPVSCRREGMRSIRLMSSRAVVGAFSRLAGIAVDLTALDQQAAEVEKGLVELLDRLEHEAEEASEAEAAAAEEDEDEAVELVDEVPGAPEGLSRDVRARIETLFERAHHDRQAALELKAELDRQGVFKKYEDRFLDLFKRGE